MAPELSVCEREFIREGGNLWYVSELGGYNWAVVRLSRRGSQTIAEAAPSRDEAVRLLFEIVRPPSSRTRTVVHHQIARPDPGLCLLFPCLA